MNDIAFKLDHNQKVEMRINLFSYNLTKLTVFLICKQKTTLLYYSKCNYNSINMVMLQNKNVCMENRLCGTLTI